MFAVLPASSPPIERITIESDNPWAFGYVRHQDPAHRYIRTRNEYLDAICVALGAREAEALLLDDLSMGAVSDLETATAIARELVEVHGLGGPEVGMARFVSDKDERQRRADLSEGQKTPSIARSAPSWRKAGNAPRKC